MASRTPEERALSNFASGIGAAFRDLTREPTAADAARAEVAEGAHRAGAAISARWAQFTTWLSSLSHRAPAPRRPAQPATDYSALLAAEAAAPALRTAKLRTLLGEVSAYREGLQQRVDSGEATKYNGFGSFLKTYLRFSDVRLKRWGIYPAADKLPLAKHVEAAVRFSIDGTVTREVDTVTRGVPDTMEMLSRGRLGKLAEGAEFWSYEEMRRQKAGVDVFLTQLNGLSITASITALTKAVESLEEQAKPETLNKAIITAANDEFELRRKEITVTVERAKQLFDRVSQYCGRDKAKLTLAIANDVHVNEAHTKHTALRGSAQTAFTELNARAIAARKTIDQIERRNRSVAGRISAVMGGGVSAPPVTTGAGAGSTAPIVEARVDTAPESTHTSTSVIGAAKKVIYEGVQNFFHRKKGAAPATAAMAAPESTRPTA
jgi:hypothetical protein